MRRINKPLAWSVVEVFTGTKLAFLSKMALKLAQNTHDITINVTDCKFIETLEYQWYIGF